MTGEPSKTSFSAACPAPIRRYDAIVLGHGSGGALSRDLVRDVFLPRLGNEVLEALEDQATVDFEGGRLALTTDAFVVQPIFFPGGNIGDLAVYGTVNDLAMGGAIPRYLTASFILEEGLPLEALERIVDAMRVACERAKVAIVAGDTKVVERGARSPVFITTTGVGVVPKGRVLSIRAAKPGDRILVSGTLGDHGMAIMSVREGLAFETALESDTAPLTELVERLLAAAPGTRALRDPTRGGLASALNELAASSGVGVELEERALPVRDEVRAACELLGLDPVQVANEGKLMAVVPEAEAQAALEALRAHPLGTRAAILGRVVDAHPGVVTLRSLIGGQRVVSMLAGEQLPRIC